MLCLWLRLEPGTIIIRWWLLDFVEKLVFPERVVKLSGIQGKTPFNLFEQVTPNLWYPLIKLTMYFLWKKEPHCSNSSMQHWSGAQVTNSWLYLAVWIYFVPLELSNEDSCRFPIISPTEVIPSRAKIKLIICPSLRLRSVLWLRSAKKIILLT